jgi:hypothetical protein
MSLAVTLNPPTQPLAEPAPPAFAPPSSLAAYGAPVASPSAMPTAPVEAGAGGQNTYGYTPVAPQLGSYLGYTIRDPIAQLPPMPLAMQPAPLAQDNVGLSPTFENQQNIESTFNAYLKIGSLRPPIAYTTNPYGQLLPRSHRIDDLTSALRYHHTRKNLLSALLTHQKESDINTMASGPPAPQPTANLHEYGQYYAAGSGVAARNPPSSALPPNTHAVLVVSKNRPLMVGLVNGTTKESQGFMTTAEFEKRFGIDPATLQAPPSSTPFMNARPRPPVERISPAIVASPNTPARGPASAVGLVTNSRIPTRPVRQEPRAASPPNQHPSMLKPLNNASQLAPPVPTRARQPSASGRGHGFRHFVRQGLVFLGNQNINIFELPKFFPER